MPWWTSFLPKAPAERSSTANLRVTEIYSDSGDGSRGTGFLLGDGLILTARHVLRPKGAGAPTKITARPLGMARRVGKLQPAELVWPQPADLANLDVDAALIRLVEPPLPTEFSERVRIGYPDEEPGASSIEVEAVGFPAFTPKAGDRQETEQLSGRVYLGNGIVGQRFIIEDRTLSSGKSAVETLDWRGFSGAALRSKGRVIGVVTLKLTGRRYDFSALRIESLLEIKTFRDAIQPSVEIASEQASEIPPPPQLDHLACLFGRDAQEQDFHRYYKKTQIADAPARAMLCLVPGAHDDDHCPRDLPDRFSLTALPELAWPQLTKFVHLPWPETGNRADDMGVLQYELWNFIRTKKSEGTPAEPKGYAELIKNGTGQRLFYSDLAARPLDLKTLELISEWSRFWAALSVDKWPPIHLLLLHATTAEEVRERLTHVAGFEGVVIEPLRHLCDCHGRDFKAWIDRMRLQLDPIHQHWPNRLQLKMHEEFAAGEFKMKKLKDRIATLMAEEWRNG